MPRVAIDPVARTIRVDDRVWPFEWEPAAATAAIVLDGRRFELQTMTWRQKCNLARAARKIGPFEDALGAALASACLPPRTALPDSADERAALVDLARWLIADENVAPLEPVTLARITVDVCRATQLAPQMLDTLPAAEVEAIWSVARQENRATQVPSLDAAPPAGVTRIVVLPDPADVAAPHKQPTLSPQLFAGEVAPSTEPAAASAPVAAAADRDLDAHDDSDLPSRTAAPYTPSPRAVDGAQSLRARPADRVTPGMQSRTNRTTPQPRVRVSRVTARIGAAAPPVVRRGPLQQNGTTKADTLRGRAALDRHERVADGQPSARQLRTDDCEPASALPASRPSPDAVNAQLDDAPQSPAAPAYDPFISDTDPFAAHQAPAPHSGADPFELFDDFERAAVEAGIDLEA